MAATRKATATDASQVIGINIPTSNRKTHKQNMSGSTGCGELLAGEDQLSRLLRRARPLYFAPKALRTRVSGILSGEIPGLSTSSPQPPILEMTVRRAGFEKTRKED
jgi:hypothetical protein